MHASTPHPTDGIANVDDDILGSECEVDLVDNDDICVGTANKEQ